MPTQDISRHLHQPEKHYAGVRMQQGRVILDSDWNERSSIEAEDFHRTISELACSKGTPNAGMTISTVSDEAPYNFEIANGSYYLGGMRLVVDAADGAETYITQSDWLQIDATDGSSITVPAGDRIDLVYVYAWEQPVSAVEDSELFEVALGGRETSVRTRRMRRFHVMTVAEEADPDFGGNDALDALEAGIEGLVGTFDRTNNELLSNGRMVVGINLEAQSSEDPCNAPEVEGYVGAENQAIRVELRAGKRWTWGFDNASPLYRVKVGESLDTLIFITEPADLPSMPRAEQVVEIHRWGAKLPNVEKVAELQGTLHKVETTYDPTTKQLVLQTPVTASWVDWLDDHPGHHNPDDEEAEYLYLRVWDRGLDTSAAAELSYEIDQEIPLGDTGLTITMKAHGVPGDHWIIAARPSTPDRFVPWNLDTPAGVPPHGPRRFYGPLALIRWNDGVPSVDDLRTRMRPLCESGCCKVTVGDGNESHGQVETLQEAIDLLAESGGKICVLPGVHEGTAILDGLTDILIEGCGPRSILTNPRPETPSSDPDSIYDPVLKILDCQRISVKNLRIEAYHAFGVRVDKSISSATCSNIRLEHLDVQCLGNVGGNIPAGILYYEKPRSGIAVLSATEVDICDCKITMAKVTSDSHAVVLCGTHLRMHHCTVLAEAQEGFLAPANGGIGIRSTSRDVEIRGCHIEGGYFCGIALGHQIEVQRLATETPIDWFTAAHGGPLDGSGTTITANDNCFENDDPFEDEDPEDPEWVWVPAGPVEDVRIYDNVIRGMGGSGIATAVFFRSMFDWDGDNDSDGVPRFIIAAELDIARNLIEGNARATTFASYFRYFDRARGGIALAAALNAWIHENTIRNNGSGGDAPVCGIGVVAGQNVVIEDNRIVDNGARHPGIPDAWEQRGLRGGIAIWEATRVRTRVGGQPTFPVAIPNRPVPGTNKTYTTASAESAVIVRGNEVSHPLGKALWIRRAFGSVTVTGNSFEGFGDPVNEVKVTGATFSWNTENKARSMPARGVCVEIIDYGISPEVAWAGSEPFETPKWCDPAANQLVGGEVLFSSNMCSLDWKVEQGDGAACLISSNDSVLASGNMIRVDMNSGFTPTDSNVMDEFYKDVLTQDESYLFAGMYVGASGTGQASMNRVIEGQFDALFSIVVGPPVGPLGTAFGKVEKAVMMLSNVCSHAAVGDEPTTGASYAVVTPNVVLYPDEVLAAPYVVEASAAPASLVLRVKL
jgi:hypothetical protein